MVKVILWSIEQYHYYLSQLNTVQTFLVSVRTADEADAYTSFAAITPIAHPTIN